MDSRLRPPRALKDSQPSSHSLKAPILINEDRFASQEPISTTVGESSAPSLNRLASITRSQPPELQKPCNSNPRLADRSLPANPVPPAPSRPPAQANAPAVPRNSQPARQDSKTSSALPAATRYSAE